MKDSIPLIEYGLSIAQTVTLAAVAAILFKHKDHKRFPAFATYVCFSGASTLALLVLSRSQNPLIYFYCYWATLAVVYALVFCVVNEVFESLTEPVKWLTPRGRRIIIRIAALAAVLAVAASLKPPQSRYPMMEAITSLQRGLGLAIFSFMGIFVLFARIYSIKWYRRDAGIAAGMFLAYSFQSLWPTVNAYLSGYPEQRLYRLMVPLLELLGSLVWVYVFARHEGDSSSQPTGRKLTIVGKSQGF